MPKHGVSVTLGADNLLWLRTQAAAGKRRSLSETLDRLVTEARLSGQAAPEAIRSVVGTIEIAPDDLDLSAADPYIAGLFERSARQPAAMRARPPQSRTGSRRRRRG